MNILEERIIKEGKILANNIVKVGSFLNHQIDVDLMKELADLYYEHFKDKKIDKILTIEASGIALAFACALKFDVPLMFAKKAKSLNLEDVYHAEVFSYTYQQEYTITLAKEYCNPHDHILIIDDFLAEGNATRGLIDIVNQANMEVAGIGIAIEKGFQGGGDSLRKDGYDLLSLAIIDRFEDNKLIFRK